MTKPILFLADFYIKLVGIHDRVPDRDPRARKTAGTSPEENEGNHTPSSHAPQLVTSSLQYCPILPSAWRGGDSTQFGGAGWAEELRILSKE